MAEIVDQPPPVHRGGVASVQALVRADLEERERIGVERYGTPLQPHNGRDALVDAYQEALDLACYLRQAIAERGLLIGICGDRHDWAGYVNICALPAGHEGWHQNDSSTRWSRG